MDMFHFCVMKKNKEFIAANVEKVTFAVFYPHILYGLFVIHYERRFDVSMDYEEHYDKIYRYCYYKLQQKEMAEDITQETFLRFFQSEYHYREEPLKVMYTIARNLCIDESRKKKPLSVADIDLLRNEQQMNCMENDILTGNLLKNAMEKLNEMERDIIFLRIVNEESPSVIGKLFHISRYAVYRKCEHALQILRKELENN